MFIANIVVKTTPRSLYTLRKTDAIIVLTGGNNRVQTGLSLFSHDLSKNLFITGVHDSVSKEDIISMWKGDQILPECCITLGHIAKTTQENAMETKEWLDKNNIKSIRLVTSSYHIYRAYLEFNNIISDVEIIPYPVTENPERLKKLHFWKITFSEYNKILFRFFMIMLENKV